MAWSLAAPFNKASVACDTISSALLPCCPLIATPKANSKFSEKLLKLMASGTALASC